MSFALHVEKLRTPGGALREINLEALGGDAIGVTGPGGSGKTTFAEALMGERPHSGRIWLNGNELGRFSVNARAQAGMRVVAQRRDLFPTLSVRENLELGTWFENRSVRACRIEQIFDRLPLLAARRDSAAETLSGGERQLLAIARALIGQPRVLILDEPSAGLSPAMLECSRTTIETLLPAASVILILEQSPRMITRLATRRLTLSEGRLFSSQS